MAVKWGTAGGSGYFVVDDNSDSSVSRFQIFHNDDPDPPATPPNSKCLFTVKEGTSDGVGTLQLGEYNSPAFEIDWGDGIVSMNDGPWFLKVPSGTLNIEVEDDINVVIDEGQSASDRSFAIYKHDIQNANGIFRVGEDGRMLLGNPAGPVVDLDWGNRSMSLKQGAWDLTATKGGLTIKAEEETLVLNYVDVGFTLTNDTTDVFAVTAGPTRIAAFDGLEDFTCETAGKIVLDTDDLQLLSSGQRILLDSSDLLLLKSTGLMDLSSQLGLSLQTLNSDDEDNDIRILSGYDIHLAAGTTTVTPAVLGGRFFASCDAGARFVVGRDTTGPDRKFEVYGEDLSASKVLLSLNDATRTLELGGTPEFTVEWLDRNVLLRTGDWTIDASNELDLITGSAGLKHNGSNIVDEARLDDTGAGVSGAELVGCPAQTSSGGSASVTAGTLVQQIKELLDIIDP